MAEWKRPLLIGIGCGLGTAVGLTLIVGGFIWYQSRPKPPKPWNTAAIKADYDYALTEGENNTIVFYYTLENTTDFDYQIVGGQGILMTAKLGQQKNLQPFDESERLDYPISAPAKKRVRFLIHCKRPNLTVCTPGV